MLALQELAVWAGSPGTTMLVVAAVAVAFAVLAALAFARSRRGEMQLRAETDRAAGLKGLLADRGRALDEQRLIAREVLAALAEGVLAISPSGRVVFANPRFAEMFPSPGGIEGKSLLEAVRSRTVSDAIENARRGSTTPQPVVLTIAEEQRQIRVRAVPVRSSTEIAALVIFEDVSDLVRLQRIRRDFLDDFSHEVRTPLAGLRSAAETFEGGHLTVEQEAALRQVMFRQINRIERLVKDLAELNRIESGDLVLELRPVDLNALLADLCNEFAQRLAGKEVVFHVTGEPADASADPVRLQQVFSNLLDNAWKYGGGGQIAVDIRREDHEVVVLISDEGEGLAPAEIDRIFNRFYRVDRSRSQAVPGVGLGLSITRHLVLMHGGSIRAYNRPGGGATFEVRLPAIPEASDVRVASEA